MNRKLKLAPVVALAAAAVLLIPTGCGSFWSIRDDDHCHRSCHESSSAGLGWFLVGGILSGLASGDDDR
jgi:hypothetical protein